MEVPTLPTPETTIAITRSPAAGAPPDKSTVPVTALPGAVCAAMKNRMAQSLRRFMAANNNSFRWGGAKHLSFGQPLPLGEDTRNRYTRRTNWKGAVHERAET